MPEVSVILPVRDGARFLRQAVESILAQDFHDFELLVMDDGSEDGTPAILARLQAADNRVRVIRMPRLGIVAALNNGIAHAQGSLLARMDADDVAYPARLGRQAAALRNAAAVAVVGSAWRVMGADGVLKRVVRPPLASRSVQAALQQRNPLAHPSVMMRADMVRAAGGYRAGFMLAEDFDLWLRLAERHELINLGEVLLDHRVHASQSTQAQVVQRACSEMAALAVARRRRNGLAEGIDAGQPIDRAALRALGLSELAISEGIVGRALGSAIYALSVGQTRAATGFAAAALAEPKLRMRTRLHLRLLLLRARLG